MDRSIPSGADEPAGRFNLLLVSGAVGLVVAIVIVVIVVAIVAGPGGNGRDATSPSAFETTEAPGVSTTLPGEPCPTANWSVRDRLGQLLMVGVDASGTESARRAVEDDHVGGIFVGGTATALLTSGTLPQLAGTSGVAPFVAVDDEGGRVQRIDALDGDLPSARTLAATASLSEITALARQRGEQLAGYGVTIDFAPVLDVSDQPADAVIGDRSFADDPEVVTRNAAAFADGLRAAGIGVVFKHFPGHGHAEGDSHDGPSTTPPFDQLGDDLEPFRQLLGTHPSDAVLVGHLEVPGLTDGTPASISPKAIDGLLRSDLGFEGLVFTDDLGGMKAITDSLDEHQAVLRAWQAGADVALLAQPTAVGPLLGQLEADVANGALTPDLVDEHLGRVMRAKGYACER